MTLSACIPKDKFDTQAVVQATALGFPALNPILPDLLEWMQDLNWPVARDLAPVLARAGIEIVAPIKSIFAGDDLGWTYFLIMGLLPYVSTEVWALLEGDLRRFAEHPTPEQKLEEVDEIATETLTARRI